MPLDLVNHEELIKNAVRQFWSNREAAKVKQTQAGSSDTGNRAAVTAGKNMNGFLDLAVALVHANGLSNAQICVKNRVLTLPGFFRPTKLWDMLVINNGRLVAAIEFKSQVGSFGNNFNNRTEEAIGTAHDLWTAFRDGAFGDNTPRPFLGWIMLVEDCEISRKPVKDKQPHFSVFPEFRDATYIKRYDLLCKKLVQENLYSATALVSSPKSAAVDGMYNTESELTSPKSFVTTFAGHIAAEAAR